MTEPPVPPPDGILAAAYGDTRREALEVLLRLVRLQKESIPPDTAEPQ